MIVSVKYQDPQQRGVLVTLDDGRVQAVRARPPGQAHRPNALWLQVLKWLDDGNNITPADPPPDFEPAEIAVLQEALTSGPNPPLNQGLLTAARQRLRSQGP